MILNTPSIYAVNAFDPAHGYVFEFSYTGAQATSNRAIIIDSDTQEEVYNERQDGLKLNHVLPPDILTAGKSYIIQIQVYDAYGNYSNLSQAVLFYCYSTPQFYFSNINDGDLISSANYEFILSYTQDQDEPLNEYKFYLYDFSKKQIYVSDSYYDAENMHHIIYGLKNNNEYYIRAIGKTSHNMSVDTGYIGFSVKYSIYDSSVAFEALNDSKNGYITFKTSIITVGYETLNDNYRFENEMLVLEDNVLTYETGTDGDFSLLVKAKRIPLGEFLWTTDGSISLSIHNVCGNYYCKLSVNGGVENKQEYTIVKHISDAVITDADGNRIIANDGNVKKYISVADTAVYNTESLIVFEVFRQNGLYQLNVGYI